MTQTTIDHVQVINIAIVCHQANKAYCDSIGDFSQKDWSEAADWQRQSAIAGVHFAINNPDEGASAQHTAWCRDKKLNGWEYGPVKDAEKKTHPCLVPYSDLPLEQQKKDSLFHNIVNALK